VTLITVGGVGWWTVQDTLRAQSRDVDGSSAGTATAAALDPSLDSTPIQIRSLAVLPLADYSEEPGGDYFTAGLHEELISQLSQIAAARVVSRTSVVQYDAAGKAMPEIAAGLGVEGVVEGSVFRDGDRVRITVQLIHGPTDQHLWANSYEGTMEDAIGLQRRVAQAIAKEIKAELSPTESVPVPETRVAASPRAQEEYLKGRYERSKATPEALASAISHFEAAVEEDSTFAPAYAGLAGARFLLGFQKTDSVEGGSPTVADPEIVEPLEIAFRLDETSPEAQVVLLSLQDALGELPGIELPAGVRVLGDSASVLEAEVALTASEFGRQIQEVVVKGGRRPPPGHPMPPSQRLATARRLQASQDFEAAEEEIRAALEVAPESREAWDALEGLMTARRDFRGVARVREEQLRKLESGPRPADMATLAELEQRLSEEGEEGFWEWRMEDLQRREASGEKVSPVLLARVYVNLERTEEAFQKLTEAVEIKDRHLLALWTDPAWDSVRSDPRFIEVLSKARRENLPKPR
jgi:TolB-like protein